MKPVLSLFPGIDLFGRAFEAEGFTALRGPDLIFGQSVEDFHFPPGIVQGIIAGSPCQEFSKRRRHAPTGVGIKLLRECGRITYESNPDWALIENVPTVPNLEIEGYTAQRFFLNALECGSEQDRHRRFQFFRRQSAPLVIARSLTVSGQKQPTVMTSDKRDFAEMCRLQGLPEGFDLPGWPLTFKKRAVSNGVPIPMGRVLALAVKRWIKYGWAEAFLQGTLCECGCSRTVSGKQRLATGACRMEMLKRRRNPRLVVNWPEPHAVAH
jgi:DNA (cytosine-5)-methyltransferase 1